MTDEQVRALRERLFRQYFDGDHSVWNDIVWCRTALLGSEPERQMARNHLAGLVRGGAS